MKESAKGRFFENHSHCLMLMLWTIVYQAMVNQEHGKVDVLTLVVPTMLRKYIETTQNCLNMLFTTGEIFNPGDKMCSLCRKDKYYLIQKPELGTMNGQDELMSHLQTRKSISFLLD